MLALHEIIYSLVSNCAAGYVLTENSNKYCISRKGDEVQVILCDLGYTGFNLQCKNAFLFHLFLVTHAP